MRRFSLLLLVIGWMLPSGSVAFADDPVFSGPQVGEPLPDLPVNVLFENSGDESRSANLAATDPEFPHRLIVFVHKLTRPSVGLVRPLMKYAATREDDGLLPALVFLGEDATALQQRLKQARHALPQNVPVAVSPDGVEGPGAYGLNRNVTLTVLIASEDTVRANFAIIDPSVPVDLPKLLKAVCEVVGGEPPSVESLIEDSQMRRRRPAPAASPRQADP